MILTYRYIYAFLAVVLLSLLGASAVGARGSVITGRASLTTAMAFPCTLDVVLVTFLEATTPAGGYDYHEHDRPYGDNPGESSDEADSSYTRRDFERLFSGGYDTSAEFAFCGRPTSHGGQCG